MRPSDARRIFATAALLVLATASLAVVPAQTPGTILVGYAPGGAPPAIVATAGDIIATDPALGLAVVRASNAPSTLALLANAAGIDFAELEGDVAANAVESTSARWDSARWDSARWDSSRWDSSRWDSSRWDSGRWDSGRWDSSRWDALTYDSGRWDSSRWDSSRWDSSRWDSSRWDGSPTLLDPLVSYQWGLADMNVPDAWTITMGSNARTLCVLDSGVDYTHSDLAPQYAGGYDFVNGDADPMDDAGHGTHVAGVAAAAVANGIGTAGVANARILAVKVLNHNGVGGEGNLAQGIRFCADNGANVISMSLSTDQDSNAVRRAVEYAQARGALLVASAGNAAGGADKPAYPAAYDGVIGVAALTMERAHAPFSRAGAWVDLHAPGELIAGPFPGEGYALGTGTSQATALVAGVALLVWDHDTTLSAAQVAAKLSSTAQHLAPGVNEPDAAAALA